MKNIKFVAFFAVCIFLFLGAVSVAKAQNLCTGVLTCEMTGLCSGDPSCDWNCTCTTDYDIPCNTWDDTSEGLCEGDHPCQDGYTQITGPCVWNPGGGGPDPTSPPGCSCGGWTAGGCGGGTCAADRRRYTRTCSPEGCNTESKCVLDDTCTTATPTPTSTPTPTPCPAVPPPLGLSSSVSSCPSPHSVSLSWFLLPSQVYTLAVWPPGAAGWSYYYNITSIPQIGYGYSTPGIGSWAVGATSACGSWSGYSFSSFTVPTCATSTPTPTPYAAPTCTGYSPPPPTCINNGGTLSMTATGVQNATKVEFFAYDRNVEGGNEQGDIVWYNAADQGGGTWKANISQPSHPNGNIVVGADLQNPDYWVWCDPWKEITVPCPSVTPTPTPIPTRTPTPTPTFTPTPTPDPMCNRICRVNADCDSASVIDYICYPTGAPVGGCRNILCSSDPDCICPVSTPTPTPTPTAAPSCVIMLSSNFSIPQGSSTTLVATVFPTGGAAVSKVEFVSRDTGIATVNPAVDITLVYQTEISALSVGSTVVDVTAYVDNGAGGFVTCANSTNVEVTTSVPWWQVIDGDVMTNDDLVSRVPTGQMFELPPPGETDFPGIPVYNGTSNLTRDNVSSIGWIAESPHVTVNNKIYNYDYFLSLAPADVTWKTWPPSLIAPSTGYEWFKADGDLTIDTTSLGIRKIVLFVGGNLTINGNITKTANTGFFMVIVNGNITLSSDVTELQGLYSADLKINLGRGANPLHVLGAISSPTAPLGGGGIAFVRDLLDNSVPAEVFEYDPSAIFLYPPELMIRGMKWKEISP